jgi:hypothetical protein
MARILRVRDLTPDQQARFHAAGLATGHGDKDVWEALYAEQQAADEARAEQVRKDYAAGVKTPDTPFNRRALGLLS